MVVGLATVYTSCMPCGFLPFLIYLCALIKKKKFITQNWCYKKKDFVHLVILNLEQVVHISLVLVVTCLLVASS